jgi:hypothetical protein
MKSSRQSSSFNIKAMKTKGVAILMIAGTLLLGASVRAQYRSDSCGCPPPVADSGGFGSDFPLYYDLATALSPNGKLLSIGNQFINLGTLVRTTVAFSAGFPGEDDDAPRGIVWCPYDSDLVAIIMSCDIDTTNNPDSAMMVTNLFTYRISTGVATRITPTKLGKYGPVGMSLFSWLPTSSQGKDSLVIGLAGFLGTYCPETQGIDSLNLSYLDTFARSPDSKYVVWYNTDVYGHPILPFYFDSIPLYFPELLDSMRPITGVTFSPNDSLVAYSVYPLGAEANAPPYDTIFPQVWVCKTSAPSKIIDVINFQCCFCMYSFDGIFPVFITDSTIAVSMNHDESESSPLWEISIDGCSIVRELTFLPEYPNGVAKNAGANSGLRIFPNPASEELQILGGQLGEVHLFDLMGRERMNTATDGTGATLDVSQLEDGIYFLRSGSESAKVEIVH